MKVLIVKLENTMAFDRFLGKQYKEKPVISVLCGDQNIHTEGERHII